MIEGPFTLPDRSQPTTTTVNGGSVTSYPPLAGVHYICTPGCLAANSALLTPYRDASQVNLEDVFAGDSAASPTMTVALTFPDQATATSVIAQLVQTP